MGKLNVVEKEKFDARVLGANCDSCPLKDCHPIKPIINRKAKMVILGEAPSFTEEEEGEFFVGESGRFLDRHLATLGIERRDLHISNSLLCRPPRKLSPGEWNQAIAACKPRLVRELSSVPSKFIFGLGGRALQTITGKKKIFPWVGSIHNGQKEFANHQALFSVHPAFILRPKGNAFVPVFTIWLGYSWSYANGQEKKFEWPKIVTEGGYAKELNKLNSERTISVDIENAPLSGRIRCIGVGTETIGISVPLPPEGAASVGDILALRRLLNNPKIEKVFHNAPHDLRELKAAGWSISGPVFDTLRAHAIVASQLPHNLSLVSAIEFPGAPNWKTEFKIEGDDKGKVLKRFEKAPLSELLPYNAKDNIQQARLAKRLKARLKATFKGEALYKNLHECMLIALEMTERGIRVDSANFEKHRVSFKQRRKRAKREFRLIAKALNKPNWDTFKLAANKELHDIFFVRLGLRATKWSETTGAPTLNNKVLERVIASNNPLQSAAARSLLRYRKWNKLLKTYVDGLPVVKGRVHCNWREFGTITGRWSASPALQMIPKPIMRKLKDGRKKVVVPGLRDLFRADEGHVLLSADYSQLELRIVAVMAGDRVLLEQYVQGIDLHTLNAKAWFKTDKPTKDERDFAKLVYGFNYGAKDVTVWEAAVIRFPQITLSLVAMLMHRWFREHPAIRQWQIDTVRKVTKQQYVEAPLSGRREYFFTGRVDGGKALNYSVQATGADIINKAIGPIQRGLKPLGGYMLMQIHDDLTVSVPEENLVPAMKLMRTHMEQTITLNGHSMKFPVDFSVGHNWARKEEIKHETEAIGILKKLAEDESALADALRLHADR